ncbi:coiled-coil domain-containing protein 27 isoform X3 [Hyla sarda]|nr:coiled-coil domain-containing protein 27 isoform X3 [Hyla sarda]
MESSVSSQIINLHTNNGTSHGSGKLSNSAPSSDRKLPHIRNNPELHRSHLYLDGANTQTYLTSVEINTPWYISVLNEKEHCLLKLGEEINRLSRYEVESKRKDQIISSLRSEVSQLRSEVHRSVLPGREEDPSDLLSSHLEDEFLGEFPTIVTEEKSQWGLSRQDPSSGSERSESAESSEETLPEKQSKSRMIAMETEILVDDIAAENNGCLVAEKDEDSSPVSIDQPEDKDQLIQKLQEDIETMRKDHEISKGVISSLQKSISSHESKLRKSTFEKESLQRELKEREVQIHSMSRKFSSLREERKHEELMATTEQENHSLREMMGELKGEVSRRNEMITELKSEVQRLQKEISKYQAEGRKREEERSLIQSKAEDLASSEQHLKVALETTQTRFERFRSKIIQAAYIAPGFKGPQVEISDNEILETMQKIIADRSDFHQQLKQKGVKVPPLHVSETSPSVKQTSFPSRKKAV